MSYWCLLSARTAPGRRRKAVHHPQIGEPNTKHDQGCLGLVVVCACFVTFQGMALGGSKLHMLKHTWWAHVAGAWGCLHNAFGNTSTRQCQHICFIPLHGDLARHVKGDCWRPDGCLVVLVACRGVAASTRLLSAQPAVKVVSCLDSIHCIKCMHQKLRLSLVT